MRVSRDDLEPDDRFLVRVENSTEFKLEGRMVDHHGKEFGNVPVIRLWAGHGTALKKASFGQYAEVELMHVGSGKGQLRAKIIRSGTSKKWMKKVHRDWLRTLSFRQGDYDSPLSELSDNDLEIDPPTTEQEQETEDIKSKHMESDDEWGNRKKDTMDDLPGL